MPRTFSYLLLLVGTLLLQLFFFDNLSISVYFCPLVYIAFVILLPLDTPPVVVLLAGFVSGVLTDWTMGTEGLNTLATLPVAFLRPTILRLLNRREDFRDGGIPSPERLGRRVFANYLIVMVLLHHLLFFSLEALSWTHLVHTLLRLAVSSVVSLLFVWLIARLFATKFSARV